MRIRALWLLVAIALSMSGAAACGGSKSADDRACDRWSEVVTRGQVRNDEQTRADVQAILDMGPSPKVQAPAKALQVAMADGIDPGFTAGRLTAACEAR